MIIFLVLAIVGIGIIALFWNPPEKSSEYQEENDWGGTDGDHSGGGH